ncbi:TIGR01777 family oxidoreductase [Hymenobacter lapidiphilus]|uniref:TIGR01777 family protein n=1 Tax=Hymenobacter lapidiphilus TaxID=2608003 RepID=A0A7Y7U3T1_9BACT|nr:TIGR01777 family oxidoreductase [Hymenobacter lapidiphilus]NVO29971.1 TIGR01777 family protein [Hymenobacter lapidiphilus]
MSRKVLITGGTGMIGTRLSEMLIDAGYEVALLSRTPGNNRYFSFRWDPLAGTIDDAAVPYADYIVNLAGSSVSDGKWTQERKRQILSSRVAGTQLLAQELRKATHHVRGFISASAIGIYGDQGDQLLSEETAAAPDDFLANVCRQWEEAAEYVAQDGVRTAILRIGIVLSPEGGALVPLARTVKMLAGAPLGSGKQFMSWIHLDDLCRLFIKAIEDEQWQGVYNAVAPNPVTNKEFTETLADVLHRPLVLPKVPEFGLKLMMGEMSEIVLASQRVSAEKVLGQGFRFEFPALKPALESFYGDEK